MKNIKIFSGRNSIELSKKIIKELCKMKGFHNSKLGKMEYKNFSDGELWLRFGDNIRGNDVFIIQSTNPPAENLMELLLMIDGAKRASAKTITAVIPYFGYARQDRKDQPRVPITSKLIANMLRVSGVDRIITMDLHASQIQGFFDFPVDHLYASAIFIPFLQKQKINNLTIVSPDAGGMKLARAYSTKLNADLIMIDKQRDVQRANVCKVMNIVGNPKDKNLIIVDDLIDTGSTIINAVHSLKEKGALDIYVLATHSLFSQGIEKFNIPEIKKVYVTDTINVQEGLNVSKLSTSKLFAETIYRIYNNKSISSLFV